MKGTEINHLLKLFTIFQFLLFAFFLVTHKKGRKQSLLPAALLSTANGVWYAGNLGGGATLSQFPFIRIPCWGFFFLIGPALYFYVQSLVSPTFSLKKKHLLHGVSFIIAVTVLSIFPGFLPIKGESSALSGFGVIKYIHFAVYGAAVLKKLKQHRRSVKNLFSTLQKKELAWLYRLTIGFLMTYGLFFLHYLHHVAPVFPYVPPLIPILLFFLLANLLIYNALTQPEIFSAPAEEEKKYTKTVIPENTAAAYLEKLLRFMESEKPYLDPLLNLPQLSQKLGIPAHYISQLINTRLQQNFYTFITHYRIKESMRRFSEPPGKKQTILEVMYASGFNSKSVFNTAFKKHTGMTPRDFVKQTSH